MIITDISSKLFEIIEKINLVVCPVVLWLEIDGEVGVALCCLICPWPDVFCKVDGLGLFDEYRLKRCIGYFLGGGILGSDPFDGKSGRNPGEFPFKRNLF